MVVQVNAQNFEKEVLQSDIPVLVDFFAEWCGPCKVMGPVVDRLSDQIAPDGKVCKLDIDKDTDLAQRYDVSSVPTFMMFYNGEPIDTRIGTSSQEELLQMF